MPVRRAERGQAFVLFACALTVILGFGSLSFDLASFLWERTSLQNIADAAATAGVQDLPGDQDRAVKSAWAYAMANGASGASRRVDRIEVVDAGTRLCVVVRSRPRYLLGAILGLRTMAIAAGAVASVQSPTVIANVMPWWIDDDVRAKDGALMTLRYGRDDDDAGDPRDDEKATEKKKEKDGKGGKTDKDGTCGDGEKEDRKDKDDGKDRKEKGKDQKDDRGDADRAEADRLDDDAEDRRAETRRDDDRGDAAHVDDTRHRSITGRCDVEAAGELQARFGILALTGGGAGPYGDALASGATIKVGQDYPAVFENVVATTGKALAERLANTSKGCEKFSAVFEDTGDGWRFRTPACNPWAPEGQCDAWSPCSRRVVLVPRVIGQADGRAAVDVDGLALAFIESVTCTKEKRCDVAVRFVTGRSSIAVGASLGTYNAATGIRVSHLTQ